MSGGSVLAVGIDLVEVDRIRFAHRRWGERFLARIFTAEEIQYCCARRDPYPSLAARFAGKEAVAKALGSGFGREISFRSVAIFSDGGVPRVRLLAPASERMGRLGGGDLLISLSHTASMAIGQAVLLGASAGP
ncbi:MAG: holo-ACP synthase [Puniceicoccales bacterium]|jgi:holo-[acyl-carrier protein] synthase|nr:holo-ACP synthase [Puniceicoccales bacterium]